jgi:hypothetical protein
VFFISLSSITFPPAFSIDFLAPLETLIPSTSIFEVKSKAPNIFTLFVVLEIILFSFNVSRLIFFMPSRCFKLISLSLLLTLDEKPKFW